VGAAAAAVYAAAQAAGFGRADDSVLYRWALTAPPPAGAETAP